MAKDPTFPFYAQDYLVDTIRWSRAMQGLHVSLMAESWANDGLVNEGGMPEGLGSTDVDLWLKIKHKWTLVGDKWRSPKIEEVRTERKAFREKQREKGILSGKKRNQKSTKPEPKTSSGSTTVEPIESESESEEVLKNNKERERFLSPDIEGDCIVLPFETDAMRNLWAAWKESRWTNHNETYGMYGELAALKQLQGLNFQQIDSTIQQAIAGKWKNLYPERNGNGNSKNKQSPTELADAFAVRVMQDSSGK